MTGKWHVSSKQPHWPLQTKQEDIEKYRGRYEAGWDVIRAKRFAKQKQIGLFDEQTKLNPRDQEAGDWSTLNQEKQNDLAETNLARAAELQDHWRQWAK